MSRPPIDEFRDEIRKTLFTRPPCTNDSHHFIPYNSGNMICSKCGTLAKIGRLGLREGEKE